MAIQGYDFTSLSPLDFEILVRDLLQEELKITLENFPPGKDEGIDLRYVDSTYLLVIQCKRFIATPFPALLNRLKKEELEKVKRLKPDRYIFVTSLELSKGQKDKIFDLFFPFINSPSDIYSKTDLNNLLRKYPKVERSNFKLWLTSTSLIENVLKSGILTQRNQYLAEIQKKTLRVYVRNKSFEEAINLLQQENYCIISGIPGIGKTTLAEILLMHYIYEDFEPVLIFNDIYEGFQEFDKSEKQIFFYDDFLGQTNVQGRLNKNEDATLIQFIKLIRDSPQKKLLLATREYILNQAKQYYEKLDKPEIDINKCIITLDKYSKSNKTQILYNHLYYSNLPVQFKQFLLSNKEFWEITKHKNFSPRIIERMTSSSIKIEDDKYLENFIANLDDPVRVWKHAYENHLSREAQYLLRTLGTVFNEIDVKDLEKAFTQYYMAAAKKYNFSVGPDDFRHALAELENDSIRIERRQEYTTIDFHNPSIRDFIENRLLDNSTLLNELCNSAIFFEQIYCLWFLVISDQNEDRTAFIDNHIFVEKIYETFSAESCEIKQNYYSKYEFHYSKEIIYEKRFSFALDWARNNVKKTDDNEGLVTFLAPLSSVLVGNLRRGVGNPRKLWTLLQFIVLRWYFLPPDLYEKVISAAKYFLVNHIAKLDDFEYFLSFRGNFNNLLNEQDIKKVRRNFILICSYTIDTFYSDPTLTRREVRYLIKIISEISEALDLDFQSKISQLRIVEKALAEREAAQAQGHRKTIVKGKKYSLRQDDD